MRRRWRGARRDSSFPQLENTLINLIPGRGRRERVAGAVPLDEKITLSLAEAGGGEPSVTQLDLCAGWAVSRGHVSRTLERLKSSGLVAEANLRLPGAARAVKAYGLTAQGRAKADEVRRRLLAKPVRVMARGEDRGEVPIEAALGMARQALRLSQVVREVEDSGRLDIEAPALRAQEPARGVADLSDAPARPPVLAGRDRELDALAGWWSSAEPAHLALLGPGGIGKSALLATALRDRPPPGAHVVWFDAANRVPDDLQARLAKAFGRPGRRAVGARPDARALVDALGPLLRNRPLLVVVDPWEKASPELRGFVDGLARAARTSGGVRLLLASRTPVSISVPCRSLLLEPLAPEDAARLAEEAGTGPSRARQAASQAGGNPAVLAAWSGPPASSAERVASELHARFSGVERSVPEWLAIDADGLPLRLMSRLVADSEFAVETLRQAGLCIGPAWRPRLPTDVRAAVAGTLGEAQRRRMHSQVADEALANGLAVDEFLHHLLLAGEEPRAIEWLNANAHLVLDEAFRLFGAEPGQPA